MKLIVGLGNPGREYTYTRHNAGFLVLDSCTEHWDISFDKKKYNSHYGVWSSDEGSIGIVKPQTFMNLSGVAVKQFCSHYMVDPAHDLLVLVDDIHLPFGKVRVRPSGSAGGHNGLTSIIQELGTTEFARVRIGIDKPAHPSALTQYVLEPFSKKEREKLPELCDTVRHICVSWLEGGIKAAMNRSTS